MGDPVITDECRYDRELSEFERREIELDRYEKALMEDMLNWSCKGVMDELLRKPNKKRVMVFCSFLTALENAVKELAKDAQT